MVEKWNITIPQLTGDKERRAYVYLPEEYDPDDEERYPVLYMFDGHNVFFDEDATYGKSWGMADFLDAVGARLIVAAVECNHEGNGRLEEYTPVSFRDRVFGEVNAKGTIYMDWLVDEFKPYIDANYKTLPGREHTAIAGSSMGGLMSLYAVTAYNRVFSKAAALSPSLWVSKTEILRMLRECPMKKDTVIYMDYGSREMANHRSENSAFRAVTDYLIKNGFAVTSRIVSGGTHTEESWQRQIPVFMQCLGLDL